MIKLQKSAVVAGFSTFCRILQTLQKVEILQQMQMFTNTCKFNIVFNICNILQFFALLLAGLGIPWYALSIGPNLRVPVSRDPLRGM